MPKTITKSKPVSPARVAAFEILSLVADGKGNSDDLLYSAHTANLSQEDRNLTMALVLGTLRWQIALDARIQPLLERPDQRLAEPIAIALRLGAFQLLHLDRIPPHAALNESVELARVSGNAHASGMVNAILRKLASAKPPGRALHESSGGIGRRLGHPQWLVERWVAQYGRAVAIRICEAGQAEPAESSLFVDSTSEALPRIDDGSRLVAELTVASASASAPHAARLWDACAAPGGKTLILARRLPQTEIFATDVSPRRLKAMQTRFADDPIAAKIHTEIVDATAPPAALESFNLILADAPCSGTGTLSRNPEIRLRLTAPDLTRHADRQRKILGAALSRLAPGGRLLYSVCSLEPEECEQVIEAVTADPTFAKSVRVLPLQPLLDGLVEQNILREPLREAVRGSFLRTLPGVHAMDGFFAALLERTA